MPEIAPYVASSNAIATAVGKIGGIPSVKLLKSGAITPIKSPYCHPQIKPHKITGICIGHSIFPTEGI